MSPESGLLFRGCVSGPSRGVGGHCRPDQFLEGGLVELLAFADVDGSARVPLETVVRRVGVDTATGQLRIKLHDLKERSPDGASLAAEARP